MNRNGIQRLFKTIPFSRYFANQNRGNICPRHICDPSYILNTKEKAGKRSCLICQREPKNITHAIIDLDGVILNAKNYNITAHEQYLARWKKYLTLNKKYCIMSMRNVDAGKIVTAECELPFSANFYAKGVWQCQQELYPKACVIKGVFELLDYFVQQRIPMALISSSTEPAFMILYNILQKAGLHSCFCHYVHGDMVKEGKPNPEMLCKAASMFCNKPNDVSKYLVIDSGVCGALAARVVGMQSVLVTDECTPVQLRKVATVTLPNIKLFKPEAFDLPPMKYAVRRK